MSQDAIIVLFALLRSAVLGKKLSEDEQEMYSSEQLVDLVQLSQRHSLAHLLVLGLKQNDLIMPEDAEIENFIFHAAMRHEKLNRAYQQLFLALEQAQIPFVPLKGIVLCQYYPEPWMRTSCDIDVLIKEQDIEKAKHVLIHEGGYVYYGTGSHDISLLSPENIHVELHYNLIEDGCANAASGILKNVWDTANRHDTYGCCYEMPDEYFYFYHIAHMAKHFENGGCGIRPFVDAWILNHRIDFDKNKRNRLLENGGLLTFAKQIEQLSEIWFGNATHTPTTRRIQEYILHGGVYGSNDNRVKVQQQKRGGKFRYAASKVFIAYDEIKYHYPILEKHRWLIPLMEVRRWCKLIFCGHLKRTVRELKYNGSVSKKEAKAAQKLLKSMGL